jgi:membrane fusion protein (multidrug efflux system)
VKVTFLGDAPAHASAPGRVLVPKAAVRDDAGKPVVFVVREGRAERRAVGLGQTRATEQEVTAGLTDGEQVIVAGAPALRDGQRVTVRK